MAKKLIFSLIFIFAVAVGASYAQKSDYKNMDPSAKATKMADKMKQNLNLTDSQHKSVYDIFYNHFTEMQSMKDKYEKGSAELKSYRKQKREDLKKSLSGVLTSEQIKTMEENHKKRKEGRKNKDRSKNKNKSKNRDSNTFPEKR
jgi:Spy/CpxP family protein refolding chaperone